MRHGLFLLWVGPSLSSNLPLLRFWSCSQRWKGEASRDQTYAWRVALADSERVGEAEWRWCNSQVPFERQGVSPLKFLLWEREQTVRPPHNALPPGSSILVGHSRSNPIVDAAGDTWAHVAANRVILRWKGDRRVAEMFKSRSLPPKEAEFEITEAGVRDKRAPHK